MSNRNYLAGRRLEYETIKTKQNEGYEAVRTAGSHGKYDVIAFKIDRKPQFIQCKRAANEATADRLLKKFKLETASSGFYHQIMMVKVKGSSDIKYAVV